MYICMYVCMRMPKAKHLKVGVHLYKYVCVGVCVIKVLTMLIVIIIIISCAALHYKLIIPTLPSLSLSLSLSLLLDVSPSLFYQLLA